MDIEEAIIHCERVAEGHEISAGVCTSETAKMLYCECAEEHKQLAKWLKELRDSKELIRDMTYTIETLCKNMRRDVGCCKCTYHDKDKQECIVSRFVNRVKEGVM